MIQLSITTTQNVTINFTAANVGQRIFAQLIDFVVILIYYFTINYVLALLGIENAIRNMDQWSITAIYAIAFLPAMCYSLIMESVFEGQTLGKKLLKIKVIKIDGYQATFVDYLIRWMFRIVEVVFMFGIIGLITLASSKKSQRLGDIVAGTSVISLKNNININHTILQEIGSQYVPKYPSVIKLSDNDVRIIKETFEAALKTNDYGTIIKLKEKIISVTDIKVQDGNDKEFIATLMKDYNFYTQNM